MLYMVGLGLGDVEDISVKGLEIVKKCEYVYLEAYTSILGAGPEELSKFYGKDLIVADREMVEQGDAILEHAKETNVAFLVVGDPFGATTHTDLVLRAKNLNIPVQVVHNASIMNAIGACGLQLYSFGETVSIPFFTDTWEPDSFFDKICENKRRGLHTLCLLDIKVKEPNLDAMMRGKIKYDPPRFMTAAQAAAQLVKIIDRKPGQDTLLRSNPVVAVARIGSPSQNIVSCTIEALENIDLGSPLHSLVICGNMHPLEQDFLAAFSNEQISNTNK